MNTVFLVLALLPIALWALGGFKLYELMHEFGKLVAWETVVGIAYLIYRLTFA